MLSVETQRVLDNVGQSSAHTFDKALSESRPQQPRSTNIHVKLKPGVLPKAEDLLVEVLSWEAGMYLIPQQMENGTLIEPKLNLKEEPTKVPRMFESYDRYLNTFKPLVFLELSNMVSCGKCCLIQTLLS